MIKVAFVCLGNICRSPMAELIFKKMVEEEGLQGSFCITSSGTSDWEVGNPIYPPAQKVLAMHNIIGAHRARLLTHADVVDNDFILVMDDQNYDDVLLIAGRKYAAKVKKLLQFAGEERDVADPWYTRDFQKAYSDICTGCRAFLNYLKGANVGLSSAV